MGFIRVNLARLAFALGLLLGVQAPNFVTQYEHRVTAHLAEAVQAFAGFRQIADRYFDGDVDRLVLHHEESSDRAFRDEGTVIHNLWIRLQHLQAEQAALGGSFAAQLAHVAFAPDIAIRRETADGYQATVPLTVAAIACGLVAAFLLGALVDGLLALLAGGIDRWRMRSARQRSRRA